MKRILMLAVSLLAALSMQAQAAVSTVVIVEYVEGPSYWFNAQKTVTFIRQTYGDSKEMRVVVKDYDGSTKFKLFDVGEIQKIMALIRDMNATNSWKQFDSPICDAPHYEVGVAGKRHASLIDCAGWDNPPTEAFNALRAALAVYGNETVNNPDGIIEGEQTLPSLENEEPLTKPEIIPEGIPEDISGIEVPEVELPQVELPQVELPQVDLPALDLSLVDFPLVDLSAERQQGDSDAKVITELYNTWLNDVWLAESLPETRDLRLSSWGYMGSGSRLNAFTTYLKEHDHLYSVYEEWFEGAYNAGRNRAELADFVTTDWGYQGSSSRLNAFKQYLGGDI